MTRQIWPRTEYNPQITADIHHPRYKTVESVSHTPSSLVWKPCPRKRVMEHRREKKIIIEIQQNNNRKKDIPQPFVKTNFNFSNWDAEGVCIAAGFLHEDPETGYLSFIWHFQVYEGQIAISVASLLVGENVKKLDYRQVQKELAKVDLDIKYFLSLLVCSLDS